MKRRDPGNEFGVREGCSRTRNHLRQSIDCSQSPIFTWEHRLGESKTVNSPPHSSSSCQIWTCKILLLVGNLDFRWLKLGNCETKTNPIFLVITFFFFSCFWRGRIKIFFKAKTWKAWRTASKNIPLCQSGAYWIEFECNMKQRGGEGGWAVEAWYVVSTKSL